jgi:hypothetical protein
VKTAHIFPKFALCQVESIRWGIPFASDGVKMNLKFEILSYKV